MRRYTNDCRYRNVTKDFINQRDARAEIYNPRNRSFERLKLDIECEIFEWHG